MFRALLANPQEAHHKRYLVYCVCVMSVGCTRIGVELQSVQSRGMEWNSNPGAANLPVLHEPFRTAQ
jgi:hypothetical protein